jgi:uncharacterized protein
MRLLILLLIFYLTYRALKYWIFTNVISGPPTSTSSERQIDDIMVKDPVCEVYFPKRSGTSMNINGKTIYFCSEDCKNKYLSIKDK